MAVIKHHGQTVDTETGEVLTDLEEEEITGLVHDVGEQSEIYANFGTEVQSVQIDMKPGERIKKQRGGGGFFVQFFITPMSVKLHKLLTEKEFFLLGYMAQRLQLNTNIVLQNPGKPFGAFANHRTIARDLELSERQVRRILASLEQKDMILRLYDSPLAKKDSILVNPNVFWCGDTESRPAIVKQYRSRREERDGTVAGAPRTSL